jgi:hypothetical protein
LVSIQSSGKLDEINKQNSKVLIRVISSMYKNVIVANYSGETFSVFEKRKMEVYCSKNKSNIMVKDNTQDKKVHMFTWFIFSDKSLFCLLI